MPALAFMALGNTGAAATSRAVGVGGAWCRATLSPEMSQMIFAQEGGKKYTWWRTAAAEAWHGGDAYEKVVPLGTGFWKALSVLLLLQVL